MDISINDQQASSTAPNPGVDELCKSDFAPISVSEARKVIGSSVGLTDVELERLIYDLTVIARSYIREDPK